MKISAQIAGQRVGVDIVVPVSLADGKLEFSVPTVARANACSFAVDLAELREAVEYLTDREKPAGAPGEKPVKATEPAPR